LAVAHVSIWLVHNAVMFVNQGSRVGCCEQSTFVFIKSISSSVGTFTIRVWLLRRCPTILQFHCRF